MASWMWSVFMATMMSLVKKNVCRRNDLRTKWAKPLNVTLSARGPPRPPQRHNGFFPKNGVARKTCFLSKKSFFTCSLKSCSRIFQPKCLRVNNGLADVETQVVQSGVCRACQNTMRRATQVSHWTALVKNQNCIVCTNLWKQPCENPHSDVKAVTQGYGDSNFLYLWFSNEDREHVEKKWAAFEGQKAFMDLLAEHLYTKAGVSLYLDYQDEEADHLVEQYGGRVEAFKSDELAGKILHLLQTRAAYSENFLHWIGAGGQWTEAEQSGVPQDKTKMFRHPPLVYLQSLVRGTKTDEKFLEAVCHAEGREKSFLSDLCGLCGGSDCEKICTTH